MNDEPKHQISRKGLTVWKLYGLFKTFLALAVSIAISVATYKFDWPSWVYMIAVVVVVIVAFCFIYLFPKIRWNNWRYDVREQEIEVQYGLFVVERALIPMVRVQHVEMAQGPILKKYGLAEIAISTAATVHAIPFLEMHEADLLRKRISELARVAEDDV